MDPEYQKSFVVPFPVNNFNEKLEDWLLSTTDQATLNRYQEINKLHEFLVHQADLCGDRFVKFFIVNDRQHVEINWKSEDVHKKYMDQIPIEDKLFFQQVWDDFHLYLGSDYRS